MEFVFANQDGLVLNRGEGSQVMLHRGDAWFADDPFVQRNLEKFSATPLVVHSTVGRLAPPATPLVDPKPTTAPLSVGASSATGHMVRGRGRRASA